MAAENETNRASESTDAGNGDAIALSDLLSDPRNARRHGALNLVLIERSPREVGGDWWAVGRRT